LIASLQHSQNGSLDSPIILKCRWSSAWPDKILITSLRVRLGKASRSLSLLLHLPTTISFVCQQVGRSCQRLSCFWTQSLIAVLTTVCAIGNDGSGPMNSIELACLASWSACSSPCIPVCPGTQVKQTADAQLTHLGCVAPTSFNFEPGSNLNLNLVQP